MPRPIQVEAMPPALAGRDVLGLAQTGTGKTAAFVLPILQRLLADDGGPCGKIPAPRALVVTPTRELAAQVQADFELLGRHAGVLSTTIFGGVPQSRQVRALKADPEVVVACPGRLLDLLEQRVLRLDAVEFLVLDEADHMFDMGFLPHVRRILKACPERRQNLLFSATMPPEIRKLADAVLVDPAIVELAHSRPAQTISHALYPLTEADKIGALESLLGGEDFRSAIVFLRTKRRAKKLAQRLDDKGHDAVAMQGNMSQGQRERALEGFRSGKYDVLVATDIAARGLDIAGVSHVVNFDVPNTPDAYTHRIGRTGRSEQTGQAYTFVTEDDSKDVRAIERRLGSRIERRPLAELGAIERSTLKGRGSRPAASSGRSSRPAASSGRGSRPAASSRRGGRGSRDSEAAKEQRPARSRRSGDSRSDGTSSRSKGTSSRSKRTSSRSKRTGSRSKRTGSQGETQDAGRPRRDAARTTSGSARSKATGDRSGTGTRSDSGAREKLSQAERDARRRQRRQNRPA